jgi:hypothetical protein
MYRVLSSLLWLVLMASASAEDLSVPEWFRTDPQTPSEVFEKWRSLSTREAALYLGSGWTVCGGELRDEEGEPIGDCVLTISYFDGIRPYSAALRTDARGRFIIYAPYGVVPLNLERGDFDTKRTVFKAAPGYPFSQLARSFAQKNEDWRECEARQIQVSEETAFCYLTCRRANNYDEDAFRKFVADESEQWEMRRTKAWRAPLQAREGASGRGVRNEYRLQVVSPEGKAIPDIVVQYSAYDGFQGNQQTVLTDENGLCLLTEELLAGRGEDYYNKIRRTLTLDVPGYSFGPVFSDLKTTEVNRITAQPGAVVSGTLKDWNGNAHRRRVKVRYRDHFQAGFELDIIPAPDGTFTIRRIMPGVPFRLWVSKGSHQATPSPEVYSEEFVLKPGESREHIALTVPQAAAIRGIVVDAEGRPVTGIYSLSFHNEHGGWGHGERADGRFGTYGVTPGLIQIKVKAQGFEDRTSEKIHLAPGELRFVRVVMKRIPEQGAEPNT